jgi:hypothetical protein
MMKGGTVERASGAGAGRNGSKLSRRDSGKIKLDAQSKETFARAFADALNDILREERRRRAA